ncbi:LysR family transcriptional regulator [Methylomonas rivi]|uniref:LysR family transcriptional regulator n=1 Tax=Methylomonas rivi TaxID=2952226 RepID=A0ABT1U3N1_9GAMM|nr:LysR family transcriptional regulator [Methylomonas sp. WSC-6]MCQ8128454.1 LysR family transcriptional regulator [Methylomonas sp. WSC-6]
MRSRNTGLPMDRINYQHLFYFWMVAKHGSITAACDRLHLAQPTISGQLAVFEQAVGSKLFRKEGRKLVLTETGRAVFHYADEIFALGREMTHMLKGRTTERGMRLNIGVSDAMPKLIAYRLIAPILQWTEPTQIQCVEDKTERLLTEIGLHSIDMMLADVPATPASGMRVFNHFLGETKVALFAAPALAARYRQDFPRCLNGAPFLLPTHNTALRRSLDQWFDSRQISPVIQAEVEDSALLKTFGAAGVGLFFSSQAVAGEIQRQYGTEMLGLADGVLERFYAITAQRRLKHPLVSAILAHAQQGLFGLLDRPDGSRSLS